MDTQHHMKTGILPASKHETIFDIANGSVTIFHDLWDDKYKLSGPDEFYHVDRKMLAFGLPVIMALYLAVSWMLQGKLYYKGAVVSSKGWTKAFLEQLSFLVCPPVHLDWELLCRLDCNDENIERKLTGHSSIADYWSRSKAISVAFHVLSLIEHFVLMVPIMKLKLAIDERNAHLAGDFPLTSDEERSTEVVNFLFYFGICGFALLPLVSLLFVFAYNKKGHAWSRILQSQL